MRVVREEFFLLKTERFDRQICCCKSSSKSCAYHARNYV